MPMDGFEVEANRFKVRLWGTEADIYIVVTVDHDLVIVFEDKAGMIFRFSFASCFCSTHHFPNRR